MTQTSRLRCVKPTSCLVYLPKVALLKCHQDLGVPQLMRNRVLAGTIATGRQGGGHSNIAKATTARPVQ